jgi:hypothetical protein
MNNQKLAFFGWNSPKGKPASGGPRIALVPKKPKVVVSQLANKMADVEKKITGGSRELLANTQRLDDCFASMWRRCT